MTTSICPISGRACANQSIPILPSLERKVATPEYLRILLSRAQLTQQVAADYLGVDARTVRNYLSGDTEIPYPSQYLLETLALGRTQEGVSDELADELAQED